ncbi:MAG: D-alanine--D-alanine ligase [Oligoflexia bacterium]|nr:D-alanine--D-alanine ligase [Oligoflexia bacterium]
MTISKKDNYNILLIFGGGSTEHEVSAVSAKYIEETFLDNNKYQLISVEMLADRSFKTRYERFSVEFLEHKRIAIYEKESLDRTYSGDPDTKTVGPKIIDIDVVIPCIHGFPGETGDIQSFLEIKNLPYFGCNSESSKICFNKINTKIWLNNINIPNTPFIFLDEASTTNLKMAKDFFSQNKQAVFIKASNQGSSVGCYKITQIDELETAIKNAFKYSPYVLIERAMKGRELEISVYEYKGEIFASKPGEILCPDSFYSYDEKYSPHSQTKTVTVADNVDEKIINTMRDYSIIVFKILKLKHLSRIDYFLTENQEIYLNEINTFPGLTPISMFPKMMEENGHTFSSFIISTIDSLI